MAMKTATFTALCFLILPSTARAQQPPAADRPPATVATLPTAPGPTSPAPPASTSADYRLMAGDKLRIEVYKDPQLSQSLQVRPDGKITLPLAGDVVAAGRTSMQLRDAIAGSLKEYINNPVVTVIVVETTPQVVYVMGEVQKPGTLPIVNGRMTVVQALAMAGGFTDFANRKDIRILRKGRTGMQTIRFNYKEAIEDGREPLALQSGDTVIVR
jgi:polysaccharide export outer membrane protein